MTSSQGKKKRLMFEELTPEARHVVTTKKLYGTYTLKHLQKLLHELAHFDAATDQAAARAYTRAVFITIAAVLSIFGLIGLSSIGLWYAGVPVFLLLSVLAILAWKKHSTLKALDLLNDFRICLQPLLTELSYDIAASRKITAELDLSGPIAAKITTRQDVPSRFIKLTETVFEDPWAQLEIPLVDGSTAILRFSNRYRQFTRQYRSRSGKTKTKNKWRKECLATAVLEPALAGAFLEDHLQRRLDPQWEKWRITVREGRPQARLDRYWVFKAEPRRDDRPPIFAPPAREVVGMLFRLSTAWVPQEAR
jgi:hypothetical protein